MAEEAFVHDVLSPQYSGIFRFEKFSSLQMILMPQILETDDNIVVNAPTGAGKTVLFELAILRVMTSSISSVSNPASAVMVYIAPTKAIVQERVKCWESTFKDYGIRVIELTGDVNTINLDKLSGQVIICTTPDKFEVSSRSLKGSFQGLLENIKLLMIDEVHHIGEDSSSRGYKLEVLVIRMKLIQQQNVGKFRIMACSATLQNVADIGQWLNCAPENIHHFDASFRPVPLELSVNAFGYLNNPFLFDKILDTKVIEVLRKYSRPGRQTMIFCPSKANCEKLAKVIAAGSPVNNNLPRDARTSISALDDVIRRGVAFHHSGLNPDDRDLVESLFTSGDIKTLVSTSTLAQGVNLPAYLVIVKGTSVWREGGYKSLSRIEVSQMIGRAGRKGKDSSGVAVVMTSNEEKAKYNNLTSEIEIIDSQIESHLIEAIGTEISLRIINSIETCCQWLAQSFFAVMLYKKSNSSMSTDTFIKSLSEDVLKTLLDNNFIFQMSKGVVTENYPNQVMTKYNLTFQTIKSLIAVEDGASMNSLVRSISACKELQRPLRRSEKRVLSEVDKKFSYFKLTTANNKLVSTQDKALVLINSAIVKFDFGYEYSLKIDTNETADNMLRILGAIKELSISSKSKGDSLLKCAYLERSLKLQLFVTDERFLLAIRGHKFISKPLLDKLTREKSHKYLAVLNINGIQSALYCTRTEAEVIFNFFQLNSKKVGIKLLSSSSSTSSSSAECHNFEFIVDEETNLATTVDDLLTNDFELICYSRSTRKVLHHRLLNLRQLSIKSVLVSIKAPELSDIYIAIIGRYSSQDSYFNVGPESILQMNLIENNAANNISNANGGSSSNNSNSQSLGQLTEPALTGKNKRKNLIQQPIDQFMTPKKSSAAAASSKKAKTAPKQKNDSLSLLQHQGEIQNQMEAVSNDVDIWNKARLPLPIPTSSSSSSSSSSSYSSPSTGMAVQNAKYARQSPSYSGPSTSTSTGTGSLLSSLEKFKYSDNNNNNNSNNSSNNNNSQLQSAGGKSSHFGFITPTQSSSIQSMAFSTDDKENYRRSNPSPNPNPNSLDNKTFDSKSNFNNKFLDAFF